MCKICGNDKCSGKYLLHPKEFYMIQEIKEKEQDATAFKAGMLAFGLAAAIGLSCLSTAGAVIAIGTGLYIGARALKAVIVRETKDKEDNNI